MDPRRRNACTVAPCGFFTSFKESSEGYSSSGNTLEKYSVDGSNLFLLLCCGPKIVLVDWPHALNFCQRRSCRLTGTSPSAGLVNWTYVDNYLSTWKHPTLEKKLTSESNSKVYFMTLYKKDITLKCMKGRVVPEVSNVSDCSRNTLKLHWWVRFSTASSFFLYQNLSG